MVRLGLRLSTDYGVQSPRQCFLEGAGAQGGEQMLYISVGVCSVRTFVGEYRSFKLLVVVVVVTSAMSAHGSLLLLE